ncbi:MAG: hypothetical protein JJU10_04445 [Idiomarina sp.]|nr:hypothetical protein [Idiomarina sp.]
MGLLWAFARWVSSEVFVSVAILVAGLLAFIYGEPLRLLRRRALLEHVTAPESILRQWLWRGRWGRVPAVILGLLWGVFFVVTLGLVTPTEWLAVSLSCLSFALLFVGAGRFVDSQIGSRYRDYLRLRVALLCNLPILLILFVMVTFFWGDAAASRHLSLETVISDAASQGSARFEHPLLSGLSALTMIGYEAAWHLMQTWTAQAEMSRSWLVGAWIVFLLIQGAKAYAVWLVLNGVLTLIHLYGSPPSERRDIVSWRFMGLVAAITVLLLWLLPKLWTANLSPDHQEVEHAALDCPPALVEASSRQLYVEGQEFLEQEVNTVSAAMEAVIRRDIEEVFAGIESGVDRFLDWNFSVSGQYQQGAFLVANSLNKEAEFGQYLADKLVEFVFPTLGTDLAAQVPQWNSELEASLMSSLGRYDSFIGRYLPNNRCVQVPPLSVDLTSYAEKSAVGAGPVVGLVAARFASGMGARAMGSTAMRRTFAALLSRAGARAATVGASGGATFVCGPLCTVAVGTLGWIATDIVISRTDDALNRERMRAEILATIEEDKEALIEEVSAQYARAAHLLFLEIDALEQERFNIRRDLQRATP